MAMMITPQRCRILFATALTLLGVVARSARSQDPDLAVEVDQVLPQVRVFLGHSRFDAMVFGQTLDVDAVRKRVETLLKGRVEALAYQYDLTDLQKKKLWLAGQCDIKRFFDSVQYVRAKLPLVTNEEDTVTELVRDIQRLQRAYNSGLFSNGSLLNKTLVRTLNDKQSARLREDKQKQFRETLTWVAATLEQTMKLTHDQRRRLEKVLIEETRAPVAHGGDDYYGLIFQAANIPEAKLKPIFDDDQWLALIKQFQQVKGMEQTLRERGFLPIEEAADSRLVPQKRIVR
jgi:hypothetical protein